MEFLTGVPGQNVPPFQNMSRTEWPCRIIPRGREREREREDGIHVLDKARRRSFLHFQKVLPIVPLKDIQYLVSLTIILISCFQSRLFDRCILVSLYTHISDMLCVVQVVVDWLKIQEGANTPFCKP